MTPNARALNRILRWMLDELERGEHEVVLIPAPDPTHSGHKIRVAQSQNCRWYGEFAAMYTNCRGRGKKRMQRPRTFILKSNTIDALRRMIDGNFRGIMAGRILDYVERKRANRRHRKQKQVRTSEVDNFDEIPF